MRSAAIAVLFAGLSQAFYNNVGIPGRRPEFSQGNATQGIELDIVYDLMCSDSAALDPEFQKFLGMTWNVTNLTVANSLKVTYSFLPLPYHHEVWIPHLLVPYFMDNCMFGSKCQWQAYMNFCFTNQDVILGAKNTSQNSLITLWTSQVSSALNITQAELLACYKSAYDQHNSELRTRSMYKWNIHHHNTGTPMGYVNGVLLENFPEKAEDWMAMLFSVYNSQYRPSAF